MAFAPGDRVKHRTLGKGSYREPAHTTEVSPKAFVFFDDHGDGDWIAVSVHQLSRLSPPPKPEPYLQVSAGKFGVRVELVVHYLNGENVWVSTPVKQWRSETAILHQLKISELKEALKEEEDG